MIGQLTGLPQPLTKDSLLINVRGVGYLVYSPSSLVSKLTQSPQKTTLFIHTHVREDALDLYAFKTFEDLNLFKLIINISGIGPKTAILILDKGIEAITNAVSQADLDFFKAIPRLGKKSAQKVIIELKPKLGDLQDLDLSGDDSINQEAIAALASLGFKKIESTQALRHVSKNSTDLDDQIKKAIQYLGINK